MTEPTFQRGTRRTLTARDLPRFTGDTLFDAVARVVCEAHCLPRKELYESWEVARRARRRLRSGPVYDLACGHGLTAWLTLLLDPEPTEAFCVDATLPPSAGRLMAALEARWPRLTGRVHHTEGSLEDVVLAPGARVFAVHACGALTDRVLDLALDARAQVAVLPCCHSRARQDDGGLQGWLPHDVAVDVVRAARLRDAGYTVWTQQVPEDITPMNRLLLAAPSP